MIRSQHPDTPWETKGEKQNHLSPASRHAMGDKGRHSKIISAQRPDMPWETRGEKGGQRETKGNKAKQTRHADERRHSKSSEPSSQTCHGRQRETKQNHRSPPSRHAVGDTGRQRAGIILSQHRFYARIESPSQQSCLGKRANLVNNQS